MAKITLEEMLGKIREDGDLVDVVYKKAVDEGWYDGDPVGRSKFEDDIKRVPPETSRVENHAFNHAGYADATYALLPVKQKQMLIADLHLIPYQKKQAGNALIGWGIGSLVLAAGLAASNYKLPELKGTESSVKHAIESHEAEVVQYQKLHKGKKPSWEKTSDKLTEEAMQDRQKTKEKLDYASGLAFLAALGLGAFGYFKRK